MMTQAEIAAVQAHLRRLFGNERIALVAPRQRRGGSIEVMVGDEFVGTVHRDDEDGEVSYSVQIAILAEDLTPRAG
jgi:Protein of unknown function (DUF3126)